MSQQTAPLSRPKPITPQETSNVPSTKTPSTKIPRQLQQSAASRSSSAATEAMAKVSAERAATALAAIVEKSRSGGANNDNTEVAANASSHSESTDKGPRANSPQADKTKTKTALGAIVAESEIVTSKSTPAVSASKAAFPLTGISDASKSTPKLDESKAPPKKKRPPSPEHVWRKASNPPPLEKLHGPDHLVASALPENFPPELAFRALAAYALIRTLSLQIRLSPFTPNVFLRALALPVSSRLLGDIHASILRILFANLGTGTYQMRGECPKRSGLIERDGRKKTNHPRAGDNLTYMDGLTWPLFYDDYVHMTAEAFLAAENDTELHFDGRNVALRDMRVSNFDDFRDDDDDMIEEVEVSKEQKYEDAVVMAPYAGYHYCYPSSKPHIPPPYVKQQPHEAIFSLAYEAQSPTPTKTRSGRKGRQLPTRQNALIVKDIGGEKGGKSEIRKRAYRRKSGRRKDKIVDNNSDDAELANEHDADMETETDEEFKVEDDEDEDDEEFVLHEDRKSRPSRRATPRKTQKAVPSPASSIAGSKVSDVCIVPLNTLSPRKKKVGRPRKYPLPKRKNRGGEATPSRGSTATRSVEGQTTNVTERQGYSRDDPRPNLSTTVESPKRKGRSHQPNSQEKFTILPMPFGQQQRSAAIAPSHPNEGCGQRPAPSPPHNWHNPTPLAPVLSTSQKAYPYTNIPTPKSHPPHYVQPPRYGQLPYINKPTSKSNGGLPPAGSSSETQIYSAFGGKTYWMNQHNAPLVPSMRIPYPLAAGGGPYPPLPGYPSSDRGPVHLPPPTKVEFWGGRQEEQQKGWQFPPPVSSSSYSFVTSSKATPNMAYYVPVPVMSTTKLKNTAKLHEVSPKAANTVLNFILGKPMEDQRKETSTTAGAATNERGIGGEMTDVDVPQSKQSSSTTTDIRIGEGENLADVVLDGSERGVVDARSGTSTVDAAKSASEGRSVPLGRSGSGLEATGKATVDAASSTPKGGVTLVDSGQKGDQYLSESRNSEVAGIPTGSLEDQVERKPEQSATPSRTAKVMASSVLEQASVSKKDTNDESARTASPNTEAMGCLDERGVKAQLITQKEQTQSGAAMGDAESSSEQAAKSRGSTAENADPKSEQAARPSDAAGTGIKQLVKQCAGQSNAEPERSEPDQAARPLAGGSEKSYSEKDASSLAPGGHGEGDGDDIPPGFIPFGDADISKSNSQIEILPQFQPIKYMRRGVPYYHLPIEQKLSILEFLLDDLISVGFIAAELTRRRLVNDCFNFPYGALPTLEELANLSNVDECTVCGLEGELLCCDGCTASYHRRCINISVGSELPEGKWLCRECEIVDPSKFGTLHGGSKCSLDWFTLQDVDNIPVSFDMPDRDAPTDENGAPAEGQCAMVGIAGSNVSESRVSLSPVLNKGEGDASSLVAGSVSPSHPAGGPSEKPNPSNSEKEEIERRRNSSENSSVVDSTSETSPTTGDKLQPSQVPPVNCASVQSETGAAFQSGEPATKPDSLLSSSEIKNGGGEIVTFGKVSTGEEKSSANELASTVKSKDGANAITVSGDSLQHTSSLKESKTHSSPESKPSSVAAASTTVMKNPNDNEQTAEAVISELVVQGDSGKDCLLTVRTSVVEHEGSKLLSSTSKGMEDTGVSTLPDSDKHQHTEELSIRERFQNIEFMIVHGFVFARNRATKKCHYSDFEEDGIKSSERSVEPDVDKTGPAGLSSQKAFVPLNQRQLHRLLAELGPVVCSKWPWCQIPLQPSDIWESIVDEKPLPSVPKMDDVKSGSDLVAVDSCSDLEHKSLPSETKAVVNKVQIEAEARTQAFELQNLAMAWISALGIYEGYFKHPESYNPFSYMNKYRLAPVPSIMKSCPGSKQQYLVNSSYETECQSAGTGIMSNLISRDMSCDSSLSRSLRFGNSLYRPIQLLTDYMIRLEKTLIRACLLSPRWGMRNKEFKRNVWNTNVTKCRSAKRLAILLVKLVDEIHSRAFFDDWHKIPGHKGGRGGSEADNVGGLFGNDSRTYISLPPDWTPQSEIKKRKWERSSMSNMLSLLAAESDGLCTLFRKERRDGCAMGVSNRKKRKTLYTQGCGVTANARMDHQPLFGSEMFPSKLNMSSRGNQDRAMWTNATNESPTACSDRHRQDKCAADSSAEKHDITGESNEEERENHDVASSDGVRGHDEENGHVDPGKIGECHNGDVVSNVVANEGEDDVKGKSTNVQSPAETKKRSPKRKQRQRKEKSTSVNSRRRSGRLKIRSAVHDEIGTIVAGTASSSTAVETSGGTLSGPSSGYETDKKYGSKESMSNVIGMEKRSKIAELEKFLLEPFGRQIQWQVAGRKLFEPEGCLTPRDAKWLGRNAGGKPAAYLTYSETLEVGQPAACQIWRKTTLLCKSFEDVVLQIRILDSYLNKPTISSCETMARRSSSAKSLVQKVIRCSHRDPATGVTEYFVVNQSKHRGCWLSEESVDLSALILERSNRAERERARFARLISEKRRKEEEERKRWQAEVEAKRKEEARRRAEARRKEETRRRAERQRSVAQKNQKTPREAGEGATSADVTVDRHIQKPKERSSTSSTQSKTSDEKDYAAIRKYGIDFQMVILRHQSETKQLLISSAAQGLSTVPAEQMNPVRLKHMGALKAANDALHLVGGNHLTDTELAQKLSQAETVATKMFIVEAEQASALAKKKSSKKRKPEITASGSDPPKRKAGRPKGRTKNAVAVSRQGADSQDTAVTIKNTHTSLNTTTDVWRSAHVGPNAAVGNLQLWPNMAHVTASPGSTPLTQTGGAAENPKRKPGCAKARKESKLATTSERTGSQQNQTVIKIDRNSLNSPAEFGLNPLSGSSLVPQNMQQWSNQLHATFRPGSTLSSGTGESVGQANNRGQSLPWDTFQRNQDEQRKQDFLSSHHRLHSNHGQTNARSQPQIIADDGSRLLPQQYRLQLANTSVFAPGEKNDDPARSAFQEHLRNSSMSAQQQPHYAIAQSTAGFSANRNISLLESESGLSGDGHDLSQRDQFAPVLDQTRANNDANGASSVKNFIRNNTLSYYGCNQPNSADGKVLTQSTANHTFQDLDYNHVQMQNHLSYQPTSATVDQYSSISNYNTNLTPQSENFFQTSIGQPQDDQPSTIGYMTDPGSYINQQQQYGADRSYLVSQQQRGGTNDYNSQLQQQRGGNNDYNNQLQQQRGGTNGYNSQLQQQQQQRGGNNDYNSQLQQQRGGNNDCNSRSQQHQKSFQSSSNSGSMNSYSILQGDGTGNYFSHWDQSGNDSEPFMQDLEPRSVEEMKNSNFWGFVQQQQHGWQS